MARQGASCPYEVDSRHAIRVNDHISNIPPDAHRYIVNGHTPLEWIIDRYHIKTDKPSGIVHAPTNGSKKPATTSSP
ncbi:MAG: hypothetical protein OXC83_06915 [Chloroflexi bacterium]|nr:hypothetical protein [Chloroflexota bacterium]